MQQSNRDDPLKRLGWADDLTPESREFLLEEARKRLNEVVSGTEAQDAKAMTLFSLSVLVVTASGVFGNLSQLHWATLIGLLVLVGATWFIAWQAYRPRKFRTGIQVANFARAELNPVERAKGSLDGAALETLIDDFQLMLDVSRWKSIWLRVLFWMTAAQAAAIIVVELLEN